MAGAFDNFDPTGAKQKGQPATTPQSIEAPAASSNGGAFSNFNPTGTPSKQAGGGQQQTTGAQPGDWSSVAWNEAAMGTLPGLRAQAEAARKRLDPLTAASADVAGNFASPTTALNFVPYVGPELAGGLHEAVKSAVTNWKPDESWSDYLTNVGKDTAAGVAGGVVGHGAGAAITNPELLKLGASGISAKVMHPYFSGDYREALGALGVYRGLNSVADWSSEKLASPAAQAAIRALVQGGAAAARASSLGADQWTPW
jgi:hypothetical protein